MSENNQINNIIKTLNLEIKEFQHKLTTLPRGDLLCEKNGKYIKWYKKFQTIPITQNIFQRKIGHMLKLLLQENITHNKS